MGCNCGKPKCDGHCGVSPAVLQINNPSECVLFRKVEVPASMGTSVENPPKPGAYRNVLLYYKADGEAYLYSSDGIPTKVTGTTSDYEILTNKPKINGVELVGDKSLADIGVTNAINNALQPYTPRSELAEVAFSGSYNDLTNKPDIPSGPHIFYMLNPSVGNAAPIYHDYERTDQVTLAQFTDAIASGPVQIYIPYDGNTFRIHYVDQMDAFIPDPPMATGTLYVSFGLRDQYGLGVRRFLWYEPDTAPIFDGYDPNQSDWNQTSPTDSSYIKNKPNLATVATSGSYNDLSNKPTIPTVNNATLTIQKNGADVQTFTANQSTNATANITVPTKTSDLTNDGATGTSVYIEESDIAPSELSGEGEFIALNGTTDCSILDTQLLGNAEQTTYSGKNLFNFAEFAADKIAGGTGGVTRGTATVSGNSITITATSGDAYTSYASNFPPEITVTPNTDMVLSWTSNATLSNDGNVYVFGKSGGGVTAIGYAKARAGFYTFNTGSFSVIKFRLGVETSGNSITYSNIQMEYGSTPTSYEPYVGGIASPNPDYPQDIQVLTGDSTVKITGKNLLDPSSLNPLVFEGKINNHYYYDAKLSYIVEAGKTYTISLNVDKVDVVPYMFTVLIGPKNTGMPTGEITSIRNITTVGGRVSITFTPTQEQIERAGGGMLYIRIPRYLTPTTSNYKLSNIQLELSNQATDYEEFKGQSYVIPFGDTYLAAIGDYADEPVKVDGTWYIRRAIGKVVFDGTETWGSSSVTGGYAFYCSSITDYSRSNNIPISDYFIGETNVAGAGSVHEGHIAFASSSITSNRLYVKYNAFFADLAAFQTWLSAHPATVYYLLATPTDEEIADQDLIDQLEALAGALGYDGVTNIISTSPGLPAILSVSTYTDSAIPPATKSRAGIVRIGDGIDVDDCGTISVNAQKAPTAFTMQYADNLAGWQAGDNYELVKETTGTPTDYIYRANKFYYGGADVSFINEKTGVVFTSQELYAWLLDGNEAVLNHVPLGWTVNNDAEVLYTGNYIDGIWLKKETRTSQSGNTISFNGSAFVTASISRASGYERAQDTLGITISGYEDDGAMVYDLISIDGFSLYGSVQESSPII